MPAYLEVCRVKDTYTHTRFHLVFRQRSPPAVYHRLLLFRLNRPSNASSPSASSNDVSGDSSKPTTTSPASGVVNAEPDLYCMEESCPHLGAPLSHAELVDDIEDDRAVVVCPWHQYDFDLRDGSSTTGLQTCTYDVKVEGSGPDAPVLVEVPNFTGPDWEVVEFRPVSEEFADPPPPPSMDSLSLEDNPAHTGCPSTSHATNKLPENLPNSLLGFAHLVLATSNPEMKCALTREAVSRMRSGKLKSIRPSKAEIVRIRDQYGLLEEPPREQTYVAPGQTVNRGKGGSERSRIMMLHALANIEQYAIDLAWDIIARFADTEVAGERLPVEFFLDWAKVAEDEAKHYSLLSKRLVELRSFFGAHSVHAGLWESATDTKDSLLSRIAIIHLVAEARGVDMNPLTLARLKSAGDLESTRILEIIHADEITHVTTGHRWFSWMCGRLDLNPVQQFRQEVAANFHGDLKGPFNVEDRAKAGLTEEYYTNLRGHHTRRADRQAAYANGTGKGGDEHMHPRLK